MPSSACSQDEWVFCQWTVRVKCGAYFGVLAMWGSHNLRNLLIGLATGSPAFSSGEELALGFAVFFLGLVDLVVRTWPGTPGQIASMATVGEGAWQVRMPPSATECHPVPPSAAECRRVPPSATKRT